MQREKEKEKEEEKQKNAVEMDMIEQDNAGGTGSKSVHSAVIKGRNCPPSTSPVAFPQFTILPLSCPLLIYRIIFLFYSGALKNIEQTYRNKKST
jgi:hypothetical protein